MSYEWALAPVSGESPTGPNLDAADDADFVGYYFDAVGRLPDRYVVPGMETEGGKRTEDRVFDPRSVDIEAEVAKIHGLLARSRDLRLLTLQAQFECLAGRAGPMADAVETIADLIALFGDEVHPAIAGDASDRRDVLAELAQPITIQTGLRYLGLTGTTDVTLRKLQVAEGRFTAHSGEADLSLQAMRDHLGSAGNRQKVDAVHAALVRTAEALARIASACRTNATAPFSPGFDPTLKVLEEMRAAIIAARPDLRGTEAEIVPPPVAAPAPAAEPQATAPAPVATSFATYAEARQALLACESYFQAHEPSSAALLLVRQARQLIGQPLVKALETLLPDECGKAIVSFGPQTGFAIPAQRLKALSDDNLPQPPRDETVPGPAPAVTSSAEAVAVMRSVEDYYRNREKSSPVPLLLQRARSYMDKDFQALVDELIPRKQ